ncbi:MAG: FAD-binding oxidoreductase, partial [Muribaculaceae bacterium]|nr:FAD-binding oxidoreductase [Muribaculaceae bacterium]
MLVNESDKNIGNTERFDRFVDRASEIIPSTRLYTDPLMTLAWGGDASVYRITPRVVVRVADEQELVAILGIAVDEKVDVTFRAAGTSLSGQSVTPSVLIVVGSDWNRYKISTEGKKITLQPGVIGSRVNRLLEPYGRYFTPDPASINSAMIGGIVANNASGMSCGTHANSDRMLDSIRIVLVDGTILDTGSRESREAFKARRPDIVGGIEKMRDEILADPELANRIKHKYSIKNVTGLNLRPFVEFTDPIDIIAHCMVGSEGTLAFISEVTFNTGKLEPYKASAMVYFDEMRSACEAVVELQEAPVSAAEMLDAKSLASVNDPNGEGRTAILTETRADSAEQLAENIKQIVEVFNRHNPALPVEFTEDVARQAQFWKVRSGIFPSVGGTRRPGTTVLIEDIAFHIKDLPAATVELADLLRKSGYDDACIYGHALAGNYHFIIAQAFDTPEEIERYRQLMTDVEHLVVDRYDGSLKAEHGTGRNMAPFVEREWGQKAFSMMCRLKKLFDPEGRLNRGVIFNDDPECYLHDLKTMPQVDDVVDRCIECGFCEVNCVSWGLTLSSRQRIIVRREIERLKNIGDKDTSTELDKGYYYPGLETCAADGLCSTSCPMGINTGDLTRHLRSAFHQPGSFSYKVADFAARNMGKIEAGFRPLLSVATGVKKLIGPHAVNAMGRGLHHIGLPLWSAALPTAYYPRPTSTISSPLKVVYFPSCINRTMGKTTGADAPAEALVDAVVNLCSKAGFEVIIPDNIKNLCCGMIWSSKGMADISRRKSDELEAVLWEASEHGKWPVICDQSPCLHHIQEYFTKVKVTELMDFTARYLAPRLEFNPTDRPVAVHV